MSTPRTGFSLVELLTALVITIVLSTMVFRLFHQNERLVRDQTLVMEMQQTARVLASSNASRIDFRAALSNIETVGTSLLPIDFSLGTSRMLSVADGSAFSNT